MRNLGTKHHLATAVIVFIALAFATLAETNQLDVAKASYLEKREAFVGEHDKKLKELTVRYLSSLTGAEKTAKKSGDLDLILALRQEVANVVGGPPVAGAKPNPAVERVSQRFHTSKATLTEERNKKEQALRGGFLNHLKSLEVEMTKQRQIVQAVKIRQVREEAESVPFSASIFGTVDLLLEEDVAGVPLDMEPEDVAGVPLDIESRAPWKPHFHATFSGTSSLALSNQRKLTKAGKPGYEIYSYVPPGTNPPLLVSAREAIDIKGPDGYPGVLAFGVGGSVSAAQAFGLMIQKDGSNPINMKHWPTENPTEEDLRRTRISFQYRTAMGQVKLFARLEPMASKSMSKRVGFGTLEVGPTWKVFSEVLAEGVNLSAFRKGVTRSHSFKLVIATAGKANVPSKPVEIWIDDLRIESLDE